MGLPPKFVELLQNQFPDSPAIQKVLDPDNLVIISPLSALIPGLTRSEQEHVEEHVEERIITIQLRVKGSLIGIVDLMASPYRDLSDDEVSLLEKFGMQFAVTLENFLKYEKLKQEVNEHK